VPGAQTQAAVGDAKSISQLTNGFGFLIRDLYTLFPIISSFGLKDVRSELSKRNSTRRYAGAVYLMVGLENNLNGNPILSRKYQL
jgi:hypothetical protein